MEKAEDCMTFGERLAYTRNKKGLTQLQLAPLVGVHPTMLSLWEHGRKKPNAATIRKIAKALEVSDDWFENDDNFQNLVNNQQDIKLTEEQRKLVADNEWVIGLMIHKLHPYYLTPEVYEYFYGYAAVTLCESAIVYSKKKFDKIQFSTLAAQDIVWKIAALYKKQKRRDNMMNSKSLRFISLNLKTGDDYNPDELGSIITAPDDEYESLEYKILLESLCQKVEPILTAKERKTLKYWLIGYNWDEMAREEGVTEPSIAARIRSIRKKCRTFYNPEEIFL